MLAGALGNHPDELRADFQRFYGLNLDGMGVEYTHAHAAALCACLPPDSAVTRAQNPAALWSDATYLLSAIEYDLRVLAWQNTKDGSKGIRPPRRMQTPADVARVARKMERTDVASVAEILGLGERR